MRLLFLGDIFGAPGREAVISEVGQWRAKYKLDFVVANGENSAGGFGINQKIFDQLIEAGVDVVTTGNHVWDQSEIFSFIDHERILRPQNFPEGAPGHGWGIYTVAGKWRVMVVNVMCRLFMNAMIDDPFRALDDVFAQYVMGDQLDAVIVDVHGEAATEKTAIGYYVDGKASLVAGTHTHVPTSDYRILPQGTGYITDAGMCGVYNSIGGADKDEPIYRFITGVRGKRYEVARGEASICGVAVDTDEKGRTIAIAPVRVGGGAGLQYASILVLMIV